MLSFWELEMQRCLAPHQRWKFYLSRTLAGSGVQSAKLRRAAAFLGSWELCLHDVASAFGLSSAEAVRARLPALVADITAAETTFRAVEVTDSFDWESCRAQSHPKGLKRIMLSVHKAIHTWLAFLLPTDDGHGATLQSFGGKGAGSFLLPPQAGEEATPSATSTFVQFCALAFVATTPASSATLGRRFPRTANTSAALSTRFVQVISARRLWT